MKRLREFKTYAEFENRRRQHPMKGVVPSLVIFGYLTLFLASAYQKTKKSCSGITGTTLHYIIRYQLIYFNFSSNRFTLVTKCIQVTSIRSIAYHNSHAAVNLCIRFTENTQISIGFLAYFLFATITRLLFAGNR